MPPDTQTDNKERNQFTIMFNVYVKSGYSGESTGEKNKPFADISSAITYLRGFGPEKEKEITLMSGTYFMTDSMIFGEADSNLVIRGEGNVRIIGGVTVGHERISEVKDAAMVKRFSDPDAVKAIDLTGMGFKGQVLGGTESQGRFYAGEERYENARFPDSERIPGRNGPYLYSAKMICDAERKHAEFFYEGDAIRQRMARWSEDSLRDAYVYGYLWNQWTYPRYGALSFNAAEGTLQTDCDGGYAQAGESNGGPHRRSFVSNIPEELDAKGEYYFDKESEILYFIPLDSFNEDTEIMISLSDEIPVKIDGAKHIRFENIGFAYFRNTVADITGSEDICFRGCDFRHCSRNTANVTKCSKVVFDSCDFYDFGVGGIIFDRCGIRQNLTNSGCAVINCDMNEMTVVSTCYKPGVLFRNSCGLLLSHNRFRNAAHQCLLFEHVNEIMIEYCEIANCALDTDDCSAVYWGRDPSDLGITLRNNYLHDIGNEEADYSVGALYIDDGACAPHIYNNIFYNCGILSKARMDIHTNASSIVSNHAQFLNCHNNIFVSSYPDQKPTNLYPCPATQKWIVYLNGAESSGDERNGRTWYDVMKEAGYGSEAWKEHYRTTPWAGIWDIANENIHNRMMECFRKHEETGDPDGRKKALAEIEWEVMDKTWNHRRENGEKYDGTIKNYLLETYPDEFTECIDDVPFGGGKLESAIFWKYVYHKIVLLSCNYFRNNINIGIDRAYLDENEQYIGNAMSNYKDNYNPMTDILESGNSMFVKYGEDFTLTEEGLRTITEHLPEFHNIYQSEIGIRR